MRILTREQFLAMPDGIVYSRLPQMIEVTGLEVKGESLDHGEGNCDWTYRHFIGQPECSDSGEYADAYFDMEGNGAEYPMDVVCQRDGGFDETEKFVVYSEADVTKMVVLLTVSN